MLQYAALQGCPLLAHILLKHPKHDADRNSSYQDINHQTALHNAVQKNDWRVTMEILKYTGNTNIPDINLNTPLHLAVMAGSKECVKLLCEKGANPNLQNNKGETALHLAYKLDEQTPETARTRDNIILNLFKCGAKTDVQDTKGNTPNAGMQSEKDLFVWEYFTRYVSTEEISNSQDCHVKHTTETVSNQTELHKAIERGVYKRADLRKIPQLVKILDCQDSQGNIALHYAAKKGFPNGYHITISLLLWGANPTIVNNQGEKPSEYCCYFNGTFCPALLHVLKQAENNWRPSEGNNIPQQRREIQPLPSHQEIEPLPLQQPRQEEQWQYQRQKRQPLPLPIQQVQTRPFLQRQQLAPVPLQQQPQFQSASQQQHLAPQQHTCFGNNNLPFAHHLIYNRITDVSFQEHIRTGVLGDLNTQDSNGNTAMHIAAKCTRGDLIQILLDARANPEIINNEGKTAFDYLP